MPGVWHKGLLVIVIIIIVIKSANVHKLLKMVRESSWFSFHWHTFYLEDLLFHIFIKLNLGLFRELQIKNYLENVTCKLTNL